MVIIIDNIKKVYKMGKVEVKALNGIHLEIENNSYTAIMGPSGSGKSTLLHILGCLDTPSEGTYILDDEEVSSMSYNKLAAIRNKKIGFVFQVFNLLPTMSILQNVELPLIYSGMSRRTRIRKSIKALEEVGLGNRIKHKPVELSGGERQRTAIARALVNNPSIILADEPTGNLDSKSGNNIMNIFSELHKRGHTIIVVTHDHNIAKITNNIINLKDGVITD